jgi:hypothetical protein
MQGGVRSPLELTFERAAQVADPVGEQLAADAQATASLAVGAAAAGRAIRPTIRRVNPSIAA